MKYATYEVYKLTDIEFLPQIPAHWQIKGLRHVCRFAYGDSLAAESREDGEIAVFGSNGPVGTHDSSNTLAPVIIVGRKGSFGKLNYSQKPVFAIDTTYYIDKRHTSENLNWLAYALQPLKLDHASKDSAVPGLAREDAYQHKLPVPPPEEQQTITRFLDAKTAQIDELIAKKRQLIDKLKEKRQALIARAVTRGLPPEAAKAAGLEPNPEMRESGVEWLGPVPTAWNVIPLKWRARCSSGDGISTEDVESNETTDSKTPVIGGNGSMGYTAGSNIDHQVLAIGRVGALCGNIHIVNPPAWITDNALILRPKTGVFDNRYLAHVLRFRNLNEIAAKTAQPLITGSQVRDQRIPCPPIPEQLAIAEFLESECLKLDGLASTTETAITRLTEYRQALITSAVTGKIDVRGLA